MTEWPKVLVLKISVLNKYRGFESLLTRKNLKMLEIQLHLKELKYRFFYILVSLLFIFIILSNYYSEVLYLIISPLGSHTLIYTEISELF